jgi:Mrp family chromosome partitioning ATPase
MSQWFDVLYRRQSTPPPGDSGEALTAQEETTEAPSEGSSPAVKRRLLKRAPPLTGIPNRWSLEVQKIVFHLRPLVGDAEAPHHVVFSGVQPGPGVSTISYLVAHHLATEGYQQRVLYVNFNPDLAAPPMKNADATLYIGQEINHDEPCYHSDSTLTTVAIRSKDKHAVSIASGWLYEFMTDAQAQFDWIFVDAPPFFTTPETYSIAKACDGVVLVLKSGATRYPALKALVADLDSLGIPIIGTVLNFRQYPLPKWLLRYV